MKFIRYPHKSPLKKASVVTIGNFDGVHIGHQALINCVVKVAKVQNLQSVVVTMQPSAIQYFKGKDDTSVLTKFKTKFKLVKQLGVDNLCVLNFNANLANMSALDFIQRILISGLNAKHIIVGDDFRFGKNRIGDIVLLTDYCEPHGITVISIDTVVDKNDRVSSSKIREELAKSNFDIVNAILGRRYSILGKISKGKQLGRELNFPTINIKLKNWFVPINGIFCVKVKFDKERIYLGAASIGTRPTVDGKENILEVYILDFNKQVYGQNVEIFFYHKIRNEVKFDSLEELKRHIKDDVIQTRLYFDNKL